jgi:hypothetical protein
MQRNKKFEDERPNNPGSIEQHLDMVESGPLRGDTVEHMHGRQRQREEMEENFHVDMSEGSREGDELSGDEHSSGLQGGDETRQGMPGDEEKWAEEQVDRLKDRRAV